MNNRRPAFVVVLALSALLMGASFSAAATSERLSYMKAKGAIQAKGDRFAGARTKVTAMYRLGNLAWSGRAEWERENPTGCTGCDYDPITGEFINTPSTESCSVGLRAKLRSPGNVRVSTEGFACY